LLLYDRQKNGHEIWNLQYQEYILTFRGPCVVIHSYNKTNKIH